MPERPLPLRDGVAASSHWLPPGHWSCPLDYLCQQFAAISRSEWQQRLAGGLVVNDEGQPLAAGQPLLGNRRIHYYRALAIEPQLPGGEQILYQDERLLVVDKPHFLPVAPTGRYLQQTLLTRLRLATGIADLAPLHRLDRDTAGVMLFSLDAASRAAYVALFAQRAITKSYQAIGRWQPQLAAPMVHRSHIAAGELFFRMQEYPQRPANSETRIELLERRGEWARYRLTPVTGRKHQLRVHLAALGAAIAHDRCYPELQPEAEDDLSRPLLLLAEQLSFVDPVSGEPRQFRSQRQLSWPVD
ncbi:MAG: pseudouridine synthase [Gammaproteobacteria bacterium]|nr:pseudouridine synthase [Gammaproteobacteria bacterium]